MDNDLLEKMKRIKRNLENARENLNLGMDLLNQSITFNDVGYKTNDVSEIREKMNVQIDNLNNKIIPKINNM